MTTRNLREAAEKYLQLTDLHTNAVQAETTVGRNQMLIQAQLDEAAKPLLHVLARRVAKEIRAGYYPLIDLSDDFDYDYETERDLY